MRKELPCRVLVAVVVATLASGCTTCWCRRATFDTTAGFDDDPFEVSSRQEPDTASREDRVDHSDRDRDRSHPEPAAVRSAGPAAEPQQFAPRPTLRLSLDPSLAPGPNPLRR